MNIYNQTVFILHNINKFNLESFRCKSRFIKHTLDAKMRETVVRAHKHTKY